MLDVINSRMLNEMFVHSCFFMNRLLIDDIVLIGFYLFSIFMMLVFPAWVIHMFFIKQYLTSMVC